jgi:hypothetical protein
MQIDGVLRRLLVIFATGFGMGAMSSTLKNEKKTNANTYNNVNQ